MGSNDFYVKFWGVRGTVPVPGEGTRRYGGNTSCVEVRCGDRLLILDAGTGIIGIGKEYEITDVDILLTHTHLDHIQGLPFFMPIYQPGNSIRVWAGNLLPDYNVRSVVERIMQSPIFPISLGDLKPEPDLIDYTGGEELTDRGFAEDGITIKTFALNHPDGATAYRIEYGSKSVCYVTDMEHPPEGVDKELIEFLSDTDVFIYDCTYTDENYENFKGWGHSTWQEGVRIANEANVNTFAVFHHDPSADDDEMDRRAREIVKLRPASVVAKEGMKLDL